MKEEIFRIKGRPIAYNHETRFKNQFIFLKESVLTKEEALSLINWLLLTTDLMLNKEEKEHDRQK